MVSRLREKVRAWPGLSVLATHGSSYDLSLPSSMLAPGLTHPKGRSAATVGGREICSRTDSWATLVPYGRCAHGWTTDRRVPQTAGAGLRRRTAGQVWLNSRLGRRLDRR